MSYILDTLPTIVLPKTAQGTIVEELLANYTYGTKWNVLCCGRDNCISIGDCTEAEYGNSECVINITDRGVYIKGCCYAAMMRGFFSMLEKINYSPEEKYFYLDTCCIQESPLINFRCVHLCIFPETKPDFLKKCVRSCAISKFSHIIFEFWGMLKFDCLNELSWPFAYSKEEIKKIVREANGLGVEIIPMFNHLGHASGCREINGKHVVLDQNPMYEYMYESYGWVWNFRRDDVYELLGKVRDELIDVCGDGGYFHIGCDEAYLYGSDKNNALKMAEYVNRVAHELGAKGRRTIMWHDMLLSKNNFKGYVANSEDDVSDILIKSIDKSIIIADWQYSCHGEVWKTSQVFKANNFDVICCPWDNGQNITEAVNTVTSGKLYGIIHTTWHTLHTGFREMVYAGAASYGMGSKNPGDICRFYCASVARKAMPAHSDYAKCGWSENMTGPGL